MFYQRFVLSLLGFSGFLFVLGEMPPDWQERAIVLRNYVLLTWAISVLTFQGVLVELGVQPRTLAGLLGIPMSPFFHGDYHHLISNTVGFILFGWLVILQGVQNFVIVTVVATLIEGIGVWLFGRSHSNHIGASGVIYGYFGFLLLRGYLDQRLIPVAGTLIAGFAYYFYLNGMVPSAQNSQTSWEGHLFGFIGGLLAALLLPTLLTVFPVVELSFVWE